MSLIDTYQIATCGQNTYQTCTMASNGILLCIKIEPVIPSGGGGGGYIHGGLSRNKRRDHEERNREDYRHRDEHKKEIKKGKEKEKEFDTYRRITVIATINNVEYKETRIVEDYPEITIEDVNVEISDKETKPKITITVMKK